MPATYDSIATTTLGTAATITFSSIPSTFTDLRVVLVGTSEFSSANQLRVILNSDTNTNYSYTNLYGTGTTATSFTSANAFNMQINANNTNFSNVTPTTFAIDFFEYKNTGVQKTFLSQFDMDLNGSGSVCYTVGLWRNTAAINNIQFLSGGGNFAVGTTATLYGIKAA